MFPSRDRAGFQEPVTLRIFLGDFMKETCEKPLRGMCLLLPDWHSEPFPCSPSSEGMTRSF